MRLKQAFMNQLAVPLILMMMLRVASIQLGAVRCSHRAVSNANWCRSSVFYIYITHEGKNYKLMIDEGSCAKIITKTALEKMGLKVEPHPYPYNVNRVDKTAQSSNQHCQVPIYMSSYEDHVWCDVLDIDVVRILLCRPWLYDLDVTSLDRFNTYEFKFNRRK